MGAAVGRRCEVRDTKITRQEARTAVRERIVVVDEQRAERARRHRARKCDARPAYAKMTCALRAR